MANLEFTEYLYAPPRYGALPQLVRGQEINTQQVAIGAATATSAAFDARTELIVISRVGADCRIAIGAAPVATNATNFTRFLKSGNEYVLDVEPGQALAVIALEA